MAVELEQETSSVKQSLSAEPATELRGESSTQILLVSLENASESDEEAARESANSRLLEVVEQQLLDVHTFAMMTAFQEIVHTQPSLPARPVRNLRLLSQAAAAAFGLAK